jgi:hypothetical protein
MDVISRGKCDHGLTWMPRLRLRILMDSLSMCQPACPGKVVSRKGDAAAIGNETGRRDKPSSVRHRRRFFYAHVFSVGRGSESRDAGCPFVVWLRIKQRVAV